MEWVISSGGVEKIPKYNCSGLSPEEWTQRDGVRYPIAGSASILYGLVTEMFYIPCIYIMSTSNFLRFSCYKIMFFLGIVDCAAVAVSSIIQGILLLEGAVFCTNPTFIFISGALGFSLWVTSCMTSTILVINRVLDLWKPHIAAVFFKEKRTWIVLCVPLGYGLYACFFTAPIVFTSKYATWFFNPFIFPEGKYEYNNQLQSFNNIALVLINCCLYGFFCAVLLKKFNNDYMHANWSQYQIFVQTTIICVINLISAIIYFIMQYVPISLIFIYVGQIFWQLAHGIPAFVCLFLNKNMRTALAAKISPAQQYQRSTASVGIGNASHAQTLT